MIKMRRSRVPNRDLLPIEQSFGAARPRISVGDMERKIYCNQIFIPPDHELRRRLAGFSYLQITHELLVPGHVIGSERGGANIAQCNTS